jgi:hypothetical protein
MNIIRNVDPAIPISQGLLIYEFPAAYIMSRSSVTRAIEGYGAKYDMANMRNQRYVAEGKER